MEQLTDALRTADGTLWKALWPIVLGTRLWRPGGLADHALGWRDETEPHPS